MATALNVKNFNTAIKSASAHTFCASKLLDEIDREYHRQIRRLLSHDDLTGLLSSRSFFSELRRESARAADDQRPSAF